MVGNTNPPQGSGSSSGDFHLPTQLPAYRPQFQINVERWKHLWQKLFKNKELTDKEVHQMTDQFVNFVWNGMNEVLQDALKKQKERNQKEKEDRDQ